MKRPPINIMTKHQDMRQQTKKLQQLLLTCQQLKD